MPRLWLPNVDFEHELAGEVSRGNRAVVRQQRLVLAQVISALAEPGDAIIVPEREPLAEHLTESWHPKKSVTWVPLPETHWPGGTKASFTSLGLSDPEHYELQPWGWTESVRTWGERHGLCCQGPDLEVVRDVNRRSTRWQLECQFGLEIPGSSLVQTREALGTFLKPFEHRSAPHDQWVLKAEFGMSGRERLLGRGAKLAANQHNWVERQLTHGKGLVGEPWLERIAEAGIQIEIPRLGEPRLIGLVPLLTDRSGTYRGSRLMCSEEETAIWQPAITSSLQVAGELQRRGYFGPLGIDAMQYRDASGMSRIRCLQDLNARYTMGRLALGWMQLVPDGHWATWFPILPRGKFSTQDFSHECELLAVTPGSCLLLTKDRGTLIRAEQAWL